MNVLSTFAFGLLLLIVYSCAPSIDQQREQLIGPAKKIMADSDAKLNEDLRYHNKKYEALQAQIEIFKQKTSIFCAFLFTIKSCWRIPLLLRPYRKKIAHYRSLPVVNW